jgi:hypothetical protein
MLLVAPYNACHCRSQNLQKLWNYFDTGFEVVFDGVEIVVW